MWSTSARADRPVQSTRSPARERLCREAPPGAVWEDRRRGATLAPLMRLLVTGGAGFIGSNFVRYWVERHPEDHVVAYDVLTYAGNRPNLADIEDRIVFVHGDICDGAQAEKTLAGRGDRHDRPLRRRVPQTAWPCSTRPVLPDQRPGDPDPVGGGPTGRHCPVPTTSAPARSTATWPSIRTRSSRRTPVPSPDALQRQQGRGRPRRPGLRRDL